MGSERSNKFRGSQTEYRGGGDEWSLDVRKLLHRAPQFGTLANGGSGTRN